MKIDLSVDDLQPLVVAIVDEALERIAKSARKLPDGRLAFTEAEAAQRLGIPQHSLRDARLRGEIHGRRVGKRILYARDTLIAFVSK